MRSEILLSVASVEQVLPLERNTAAGGEFSDLLGAALGAAKQPADVATTGPDAKATVNDPSVVADTAVKIPAGPRKVGTPKVAAEAVYVAEAMATPGLQAEVPTAKRTKAGAIEVSADESDEIALVAPLDAQSIVPGAAPTAHAADGTRRSLSAGTAGGAAPTLAVAEQRTIAGAPTIDAGAPMKQSEPQTGAAGGDVVAASEVRSAGPVPVFADVLPSDLARVPQAVREPTSLPPLPQSSDAAALAEAHEEWSGRVAAEIAGEIGGIGEARFRLTPAALGELDIRIRLEDGTARIELAVSSDAARIALEPILPRLTHMLEDRTANSGQSAADGRGSAAPQDHPARGGQQDRPASGQAAQQPALRISFTHKVGEGRISLFA